MGVLFENFKLLWEPLVELIEAYASHMKTNDFWPVFSEYLLKLSDKIGEQNIYNLFLLSYVALKTLFLRIEHK